MRFLLSFALLASLSANATQPKVVLVGLWKSDHGLTMDFIQRNVKMEDRAYKFLDSLMGKMTFKVTEDELHYEFPDQDVMVNGEKKPFKGFEGTSPYKVLYNDERIVVISSNQPITGKADVTIYHFDSDDVMWTYEGGAVPPVPDLHIREYFRRIDEVP
jgi:hypothetical protein